MLISVMIVRVDELVFVVGYLSFGVIVFVFVKVVVVAVVVVFVCVSCVGLQYNWTGCFARVCVERFKLDDPKSGAAGSG